MARELPYNGRRAYELSKEADALLARAGAGIWGDQPVKEGYQQRQFERRMQKGAFSKGGDSRGSRRS